MMLNLNLTLPAGDLNLETGYLCLDFANTLDMHASDEPVESLFSYEDLVSWAADVGVLGPAMQEDLVRTAEQRQEEAGAVYARSIELREAIYRIFSAIAAQQSPGSADLAVLNRALAGASAHQVIVAAGDGYEWAWQAGDAQDLDQMLWPIARSAADLLTSADLDRVRECADEDGCGWLFYDTSRNRSRKWCSMESCGNRAKARRHYHRHQVE